MSCNCGVVVKEGPHVMAINFCGNFYSPFVGYLSRNQPQFGTGIERSDNGKSFKVSILLTSKIGEECGRGES